MVMVQEALKLLGYRAKDRVSGFSGVITSIGFDLYGCVQAIVTPQSDEKGKREDSGWLELFDISRLKITSKSPVMETPEFDVSSWKKGPQQKPLM